MNSFNQADEHDSKCRQAGGVHAHQLASNMDSEVQQLLLAGTAINSDDGVDACMVVPPRAEPLEADVLYPVVSKGCPQAAVQCIPGSLGQMLNHELADRPRIPAPHKRAQCLLQAGRFSVAVMATWHVCECAHA